MFQDADSTDLDLLIPHQLSQELQDGVVSFARLPISSKCGLFAFEKGHFSVLNVAHSDFLCACRNFSNRSR